MPSNDSDKVHTAELLDSACGQKFTEGERTSAALAEMSGHECASSRLKSAAGAGHVICVKRCEQCSSPEEVFSQSTGSPQQLCFPKCAFVGRGRSRSFFIREPSVF
ncbi:hypothetical protein KOW79_002928 [Hemibagrus wyckioides]|uniref:Uncharacterized protein n=1 Tax=Hemibagrus wyckioides TaxID=337641 RepID=A0A9D3SRD1_9TELE|nr:hypothetical protein KOW79_002928 [Hemibagrus wyckioides]